MKAQYSSSLISHVEEWVIISEIIISIFLIGDVLLSLAADYAVRSYSY